MRQRLDHRRMDRQHWIEKMCETDTMCFGYQTEQIAVAIEAPRPPLCRYFDPRLIVPVQQLIGDFAARIFIGEFER
jgi:hypothetical protein